MNNKQPTFYEILGVDPTATQEEIKKKYREAARITHPDANNGRGEFLFQLVEQAGNTLCNATRRAEYDAMLAAGSTTSANAAFEEEAAEPTWGEETVWEEPTPEPPSYTYTPPSTGRKGDDHFQEEGVPQLRLDLDAMDWRKRDDVLNAQAKIVPTRPKITWGWLALAVAVFLGFMMTRVDDTIWVVLLPLALLLPFIYNGSRFWVWILGSIFALGSFAIGWGNGWQDIGMLLAAIALWGGIYGFSTFFAWRLRSVIRYFEERKNWFTVEEAGYKQLGNPGEGLVDALDQFGQTNVSMGVLGEQMTAEALEVLLDIPGARIIHGLKFPGSHNADVDHAIVCGNKIALVDSKLWRPGHYSWQAGNGNGILRNQGERSLELVTHFPKAVEGYAAMFPEARVAGTILVHPNRSGSITTDNSNSDFVSLGTAQEVVDMLGDWFMQDNDPTIVNRKLLGKVWSHKKAD